MQWDSYIDNLLLESKDSAGYTHVDKACIIGLDDGSIWTSTSTGHNYQPSFDEARIIASAFKKRNFTPLMLQGVTLEGIKYQFLKDENGRTVYAKHKGKGGVTIKTSRTAIIIAHYPEGKKQICCTKAVTAIAENLHCMDY